MNRLVIFVSLLLTTHLAVADDKATAWEQVANDEGVVISCRTRTGSPIKEFRSIGGIDASSAAVFAVLDNAEAYPRFMPYTSECKILQRTKDGLLAYQRLSVPLLSDRDYTLRSGHTKSLGPGGAIYLIKWFVANDLGPAPKPGVQRVEVCEGSWLLEPTASGTTRATYLIYSDTGGAIPGFVANHGSRVAIRKVFAAIRKEVRDPKYADAKG